MVPASTGAGELALQKVKEESLHFFLQKGLADSTHWAYESSQRRFFSFCQELSLPCLPASEETVSLFIAYLGSQKLAYITIKSYLAAIYHLHISRLAFGEISPRAHLIIRDTKHIQGVTPTLPRLPITPNILRANKHHLASEPLKYDNRLYWVAMCLAFFGSLNTSTPIFT